MATKKNVSKRYRAKITVNGHPIYISAHSKQELERKKVETREHLRDGLSMALDVPFVQLVVDWWNDYSPRIATENTRKNYVSTIRNHVLPHLDPRQMARAVTRHDLQQVMDAQAGLSRPVINLVLTVLTHTCKMAVADRRLNYDPSFGLVKPAAKIPKKRDALTDDQVAKLLSVAADAGQDGLMIYVLYFLGLRRGEMLGLKWSDFDFRAGMVSIERQVVFATRAGAVSELTALKTNNGYRRLPIPAQLAEILLPYRQMPDRLLFSPDGSNPHTYRTFSVAWHELMMAGGFAKLKATAQAANLERLEHGKPLRVADQLYDYEITPHWFRHNYLTMLFDGGVPAEVACRLAGHSEYSTTVNIYTHIKEERLKRETIKLDDIFAGKVARKLPSLEKQAK